MNGKELTANSTSKHPLVIKILIDLDEYRRLKNFEKVQKEIFSKQQRDLQNFKPGFAKNSDPEGNNLVVQSGAGSSSNLSGSGQQTQPTVKKLKSSKLEEKLQETLKLQFENFTNKLYSDLSRHGVLGTQQGAGNPTNEKVIGFIPNEPDLATSEEVPKIEYSNFEIARHENVGPGGAAEETFVQKKDINPLISDAFIKDILSLVPSSEKSKASKIVDFCLENPDLVSWDANKILTVVNTTYPKSNIKTYLRRLYVRSKSKDLKEYPGLIPFVTVLLSSGLGHLFYKKSFVSLSRKQKNLQHQNISTSIKEFEKTPWYYISWKANADD